MTKAVRERIERQLREVQQLIASLDEVSERLNRAADQALEAMAARNRKGTPSGSHSG